MFPLIVQGETKKGVPVTFFGEIHNEIDQSFYESLDLTNHSVWVEHSTALSHLNDYEIPLFEHTKGSEWVWFTQTLLKLPVLCIDTRIEQGFMSRIEEIGQRTLLKSMGKDDQTLDSTVYSLLTSTTSLIKNLIRLKPILTPIWSFLKPIIDELNPLMVSILGKIQLEKRTEPLVQEIYEQCVHLHEKHVEIGSMSVDAHVLQLLDHYKGKPIYIFMGQHHVKRIADWLKW